MQRKCDSVILSGTHLIRGKSELGFKDVCVCVYLPVSTGICGGLERKLDPLELVLSYPAWMLGTKLVYSKWYMIFISEPFLRPCDFDSST